GKEGERERERLRHMYCVYNHILYTQPKCFGNTVELCGHANYLIVSERERETERARARKRERERARQSKTRLFSILFPGHHAAGALRRTGQVTFITMRGPPSLSGRTH